MFFLIVQNRDDVSNVAKLLEGRHDFKMKHTHALELVARALNFNTLAALQAALEKGKVIRRVSYDLIDNFMADINYKRSEAELPEFRFHPEVVGAACVARLNEYVGPMVTYDGRDGFWMLPHDLLRHEDRQPIPLRNSLDFGEYSFDVRSKAQFNSRIAAAMEHGEKGFRDNFEYGNALDFRPSSFVVALPFIRFIQEQDWSPSPSALRELANLMIKEENLCHDLKLIGFERNKINVHSAPAYRSSMDFNIASDVRRRELERYINQSVKTGSRPDDSILEQYVCCCRTALEFRLQAIHNAVAVQNSANRNIPKSIPRPVTRLNPAMDKLAEFLATNEQWHETNRINFMASLK